MRTEAEPDPTLPLQWQELLDQLTGLGELTGRQGRIHTDHFPVSDPGQLLMFEQVPEYIPPGDDVTDHGDTAVQHFLHPPLRCRQGPVAGPGESDDSRDEAFVRIVNERHVSQVKVGVGVDRPGRDRETGSGLRGFGPDPAAFFSRQDIHDRVAVPILFDDDGPVRERGADSCVDDFRRKQLKFGGGHHAHYTEARAQLPGRWFMALYLYTALRDRKSVVRERAMIWVVVGRLRKKSNSLKRSGSIVKE